MIYFYWNISGKMSFLRYMTLFSACKFNDNVALIVGRHKKAEYGWKEKQDFQVYDGEDYFGRVTKELNLEIIPLETISSEIAELETSPIHTSDLLNWFLLANYGGTVSDMDILYIKPIKPPEWDVQLVMFKKYPARDYIPVTFMQGKPCSFFKETYENALDQHDISVYESCGTLAIKGLPDEWRRLSSKIVFPFAEDYSFSEYGKFMFGQNAALPVESIGIHWYAGENQKHNNRITENNFRDFRCTITRELEKLLK